MISIMELLEGVGATFAYGLVGLVFMGLGYLLLDWTTPGKLGHLIWTDRNRNSALVLAARLLGMGAIVTVAIWTNGGLLVEGLVATAIYSLVGLILMTLSFFCLDLLTPGKLGELLTDHNPHPAAWVSAASNVAVAAIVCAAIC